MEARRDGELTLIAHWGCFRETAKAIAMGQLAFCVEGQFLVMLEA